MRLQNGRPTSANLLGMYKTISISKISGKTQLRYRIEYPNVCYTFQPLPQQLLSQLTVNCAGEHYKHVVHDLQAFGVAELRSPILDRRR